MSGWWTEHGFDLVLFVIGLALSTFFGWLFFYLALRNRKLGWQMLPFNELFIGYALSTHAGFELFYHGHVVVNPHIVYFRFGNLGKTAIEPAHLYDDLTIRLTGSKILSAHWAGVGLDRVSGFVRPQNGGWQGVSIKLKPLNPGEWSEVKLILDGMPSAYGVGGRLSDGELVNLKSPTKAQRRLPRRIGALIGTTAALVYILVNAILQGDWGWKFWIFTAASALAYWLAAFLIVDGSLFNPRWFISPGGRRR